MPGFYTAKWTFTSSTLAAPIETPGIVLTASDGAPKTSDTLRIKIGDQETDEVIYYPR